MKEKQQENTRFSTRKYRLQHQYRRHRRYKRRYSTERQSYNAQEFRIMLMWSAIAVFLMVVLIPLITNFFN